MHSQTPPQAHRTTSRAVRKRSTSVLLGCLVALTPTGPTLETPVGSEAVPHPEPSATASPDVVADEIGGIAARLHDVRGEPIAGNVFLLIGPGEVPTRARVYDATPYTHDLGTHPDTAASNVAANRTVREITGSDIEVVEMTNGPGGGPSGGLTRAIAYLDIVSGGAFTGDLRIAATGRLRAGGHVGAIDHIDAKTIAAHLADADVLFTPTIPSTEVRAAYGARTVGESVRDPMTGGALNDPRRVEQFHRWGTGRPAGMDVVDVRHLIDVSSYLCGAGSDVACDITERLDRQAQERLDELTDEASSELERFRAASRSSKTADGAPAGSPPVG